MSLHGPRYILQPTKFSIEIHHQKMLRLCKFKYPLQGRCCQKRVEIGNVALETM